MSLNGRKLIEKSEGQSVKTINFWGLIQVTKLPAFATETSPKVEKATIAVMCNENDG